MRFNQIPLSVAMCAVLTTSAWAVPQSSTTTTHKKKAPAKATTAAKSSAKAPATTSAKRTTASKTKRPVVAVHHAPQQPSVERYKEIQQALADKGYFKTEPDGNWGPASVDALKRFQREQNLVEDGKIGSLSLIALGLGPKRDAPPQKAEPER